MKKHKQHKQKNFSQSSPVKRGFLATFLRNLGLGVLLIALFFSSMYSFQCLVTKVCGSVRVDKIVRSNFTMLMPLGALEVEVANTEASRERGLSGRQKMKDSEGFLYVFDKPGRYGFWMKDMIFPLDIIWINQNGIVVDIEREITPDSYREKKTFINQSEAVYVLEVNAGMAKKFGLYLGSKVKITD